MNSALCFARKAQVGPSSLDGLEPRMGSECRCSTLGPNCQEKLFYPGAAHGERVRPRGVRQTCQAEPGTAGPALAVPRRARPPLVPRACMRVPHAGTSCVNPALSSQCFARKARAWGMGPAARGCRRATDAEPRGAARPPGDCGA